MSDSANERLDSIHAMLDSGHHSVRLDGHSLIIWGLAGGLLCVIGDWLITEERFPEIWQQGLAVLALVGGVLTLAGYVDYRMTLRSRQARDLTVSFVQRQLTKVWWLLMGLGVLVNIGMVFFGGGYMSYGLWMFLVGLALVIHGLFSAQPLKWYGALLLLLGVAVVVLPIPHGATRWLAATAFGIGLPTLGILLTRERAWRIGSFAWMSGILAIGVAVYWVDYLAHVPRGPVVTLAEFVAGENLGDGYQVLSIPAGTRVPVTTIISGDVVDQASEEIALALNRTLDVGLRDGKPMPWYRVGGGAWRNIRSHLFIRANHLQARLEPGRGPVSELKLNIQAD